MPTFENKSTAEETGRFYLLSCALFVAATFFNKFIIPLGGDKQIFITFLLIYAVMAYGVARRWLSIDRKRLFLYFSLIGALATSQIFNAETFSIPSFVMLCIIHLPYVFYYDAVGSEGRELLFYRVLLLFFSVLGTIQFFAQYAIGDWAFPLDTFFSQDFIAKPYHGLNPLEYMSDKYKATAVFLEEPSYFSQLLAIALLLEIIFFKTIKRMILYVIALGLTFSGTGLIPLLVLTPFYLFRNKHFIILFGLIFTVLSAPLWAPVIGLENTVKRATEIQSEKSSAYARFISPVRLIEDSGMMENTRTALFGLGAGSYNPKNDSRDYETAGSTWGKMLYEYGFLGFLAYFGFMGFMFFSSQKNPYLVMVLLIQFLFLGEYLFPPNVHALILAFLVWPKYKISALRFSKEDKNAPSLTA